MTCFVLSHNLQVQSEDLPALSAAELAAGLQAHGDWISTVEPLAHPHWLVKLEADGSADGRSGACIKKCPCAGNNCPGPAI